MTEKEFKQILLTHLEEYTEFNKKLDKNGEIKYNE